MKTIRPYNILLIILLILALFELNLREAVWIVVFFIADLVLYNFLPEERKRISEQRILFFLVPLISILIIFSLGGNFTLFYNNILIIITLFIFNPGLHVFPKDKKYKLFESIELLKLILILLLYSGNILLRLNVLNLKFILILNLTETVIKVFISKYKSYITINDIIIYFVISVFFYLMILNEEIICYDKSFIAISTRIFFINYLILSGVVFTLIKTKIKKYTISLLIIIPVLLTEYSSGFYFLLNEYILVFALFIIIIIYRLLRKKIKFLNIY